MVRGTGHGPILKSLLLGIMEAKTAETFKPEGWTPKLKVIEVWNKAFPKQ